MSSKLPNAKRFKRWVTSEVLPSIRKTGGYIVGEENMTEDELVLKAMTVLNAKVENLKIDGHQSFYVEIENKKAIYLDMENIIVSIYGNIEKKDLIRMAQNLELLEK